MTPRARALIFGALTVGTLDILDAIAFSAFRGVAPTRVLQSIAAGLLGRAAYAGGAWTALVGTALHYCIASVVVATYFLASRRLPSLTRHALLLGPLYGLLVWVVMNYVVIPLSAITMPPLTAARLLNGLGIHALGVGLPSAWWARAAHQASALPPRRRVEVL
jgi:hypothetical protein